MQFYFGNFWNLHHVDWKYIMDVYPVQVENVFRELVLTGSNIWPCNTVNIQCFNIILLGTKINYYRVTYVTYQPSFTTSKTFKNWLFAKQIAINYILRNPF